MKSIFRYILIFCFLTSLFAADTLFAQTKIKVAILPFLLDAEQPNPKIKTKIPLMLSEKLEQEGTQVIISDSEPPFEEWDFSQFQKFGIKSGVDYVLTGSVFMAGESISIDTKIYHVYDKENVTTFYSNADSFENLFSAISKISKEIIGELYQKKIIADIVISGNKRVEEDAILKTVNTKTGDIIKTDNISKDLRNIYGMGYFDNVIVKKEPHDKGVKVVFQVTEKPSVRKVKFKNNSIFDDEELKEIITSRTGSILNIHKINSDVNRIRLMYTEKNYYNCSISYEINSVKNSQADIVFNIEEGDKIKVEKITFEGNTYFDADDIKDVMATSEKGFFSIITSSGNLNETEVKNDAVRIESLYKNNGFVDAKVSDPIIDIGEKFISILFKINEGQQYKINKIELTGDIIVSKEELLEKIKSQEQELYNREFVRKDILSLSDIYANKGFANVDIRPVIDKDSANTMMNISYSIEKGEPVHFNRINISGNLKTRDKVIRREIKVLEQGLYSKEKIQNSYSNLRRLGYFSEVDIQPVKTADKNKMDLNVNVTEQQTGNLSLGAGVSSEDGPFGSVSVEERNLFGKGQTGKVSARLSTESILYNISFYEPYIFDTSYSGGFDLYKEDKEYEFYDKDSIGLTLKLGYKLFDYTRIGIHYNIEDFDISNVQPDFTNMTQGAFLTSSIKPFISYDSRNDYFAPTKGQHHEFSIQYAGEFLGGDIDYTKYVAEAGVYFPLFWKFTGALHAKGGYIDDRTDDSLDIDYVKFYLGGIHSLRGFDKEDIHAGNSGDSIKRGGEKLVQFNAEISFPFSEKYEVIWVFFYDRGDVYRDSEDIDIGDQFSSIGTGFRWLSPMGPIRLEYGWVIDGKDIKDAGDGEFAFTFGASF